MVSQRLCLHKEWLSGFPDLEVLGGVVRTSWLAMRREICEQDRSQCIDVMDELEGS